MILLFKVNSYNFNLRIKIKFFVNDQKKFDMVTFFVTLLYMFLLTINKM